MQSWGLVLHLSPKIRTRCAAILDVFVIVDVDVRVYQRSRNAYAIRSGPLSRSHMPSLLLPASSRLHDHEPGREHGRRRHARLHTQLSPPTSLAQALLHPRRVLRSPNSHTTFCGHHREFHPAQRRASRAASMLPRLGQLVLWGDGYVCMQRLLCECRW